MPMDPTIYLTNHASLMTDAEVQAVANACALQISRDCSPLTGYAPVPVVFTKNPQKGTRVIDVVDVQDDPQALGWHTSEAGDHIYGVSSVKPVLDHGGGKLTGQLSASSVISHEVLEMFCDPFCSGWADSGRGFLVAWEVGDPVQSDSYDIAVGTQKVSVSNFVTSEWFNPNASRGDQFDFLGKVKRPFTMSRGGYWVQERTTAQTQKMGRTVDNDFPPLLFDAHFPEWLKPIKEASHSRSQRKLRGKA